MSHHRRRWKTSGTGLVVLLAWGCAAEPAAPDPGGSMVVVAGPDLTGLFIDTVPEGYDADRLVPEHNPMSGAKVALGMQLYFDPRLSADGTISCATCHAPEHHFTDGRATSAGIDGQLGGRNAPTVINATYMYSQFWDGRAASLEEQALGPVANPIEMGSDLEAMVATLTAIPGYAEQFRQVFGREVDKHDVGRAIAAFERTILSGDSAWDRFNRGNEAALPAAARRGWELFTGKANCSKCHAGFNLSDSDFHNLGVGMESDDPDLGRFGVSGEDADRGAFRTPTLRDVGHTGPYMHDGSMDTLAEVLDWYNQGGHPNPWLDAQIFPLQLTDEEKQDLLAFMRSLDGAAVPVAMKAPALPR